MADLSFRLALLGVLTVLAGVGFVGLAALAVLPGASATSLANGTVYGVLGALLVGLGIGSIRMRRWAPALMRALAWIWLVAGVATLVLTAWVLDDVLRYAAGSLDADGARIAAAVRRVALVVIAVAGVAFPGLLAWGFHGEAVDAAVRRADPRPDPVDDRPSSIVSLAFAWALLGVVTLPSLAKPAVPWFGEYLTGGLGRAATAVSVVVCGGLAYLCFHRRPSGWWGSIATLVVAGVSTGWTLAVRPVAELYRELGYPAALTDALTGTASSERIPLALTALVTLAGVAYLLRIRPAFRDRPRQT